MDVAQLARRFGCAILAVVSALGAVRANDPLLPPPGMAPSYLQAVGYAPCPPPCTPARPRIIVHLSEPEIVYDKCEEPNSCLKRCFTKKSKGTRNVQQQTVATVMNQISLAETRSTGAGASNFSVPPPDFSSLHAAYQANIFAAQVNAAQELQKAQVKAQSAITQHAQAQIETALQSLKVQSTSPADVKTPPTRTDATATIESIESRLKNIEVQIKLIRADLVDLQSKK